MKTDEDEETVLEGFRALPTWQKIAIVATTIMTGPFMAFVAIVTAVSLFPFVLFGRWEGDLGRAPLGHAVTGAFKKQRAATERYYRAA